MVSKAVLITGCSSGIGAATARRLAAKGWRVYATARRAESIAALRDVGCETLPLDVTDEAAMRAAVLSFNASCRAKLSPVRRLAGVASPLGALAGRS